MAESEETGRATEAGVVTIRRHIEQEHGSLLAVGDFGAMFTGWRGHVANWEGAPGPFSTELMQEGLAVATLHLSSRPKNETIAWTLLLNEPPRRLFLTGSSAEGTVTGRILADGPPPDGASRLHVQVLKPRGEPHTSVTEVFGHDLLAIVEQFHTQSEQLPARFFWLGGDRYASVHGLPGADRAWMAGLDGAAAARLFEEMPLLEERLFRLECGCTLEKILSATRAVFREDPEELFAGDPRVEVYCPRCGRRWWLERTEF